MQKKILTRQRYHEQGQTMILVAISLVSLLAMAALAIDIVTLYVARSEIQRAADAAALAAAKAIADSGFTTLPSTDSHYADAQSLAQTMARKAVNSMVTTPSINLVDGTLPSLPSPPAFDFTTHPGSYQVTVSLKASNLPTFFSKVWGGSAASVTATATAEAYNPANLSTFTPIAPLSLKPWLVANVDPHNATRNPQFINIRNGTVEENVTGEQLNLVADCRNGPSNCQLRNNHNPPTATPPNEVDYVPLQVSSPPNSKNVCPACAAGASDYEQSIGCADATTYVTPTCGGDDTNAVWSDTFNPRGLAGPGATGTECLIHAKDPGPYDGANNLQDTLDFTPWPDNPMKIKAESGLQTGNLVTTSSSIVTIPIIDTSMRAFPRSPGAVTVVGFMQAFINQVNPGPSPPDPGSINITVLNIAGCSRTPNAAPPVVGGSGTSPVPVRLIAPP
jgi:Putative Flp pilus-assembly TadE/G-like